MGGIPEMAFSFWATERQLCISWYPGGLQSDKSPLMQLCLNREIAVRSVALDSAANGGQRRNFANGPREAESGLRAVRKEEEDEEEELLTKVLSKTMDSGPRTSECTSDSFMVRSLCGRKK